MRYKASTLRIIEKLKELYPEGLCSLQYQKDYELLFAVRLSAQCTDARVNLVTPALFARFPTLEAFAEADPKEVGEYIHSCGFYNGKSRDLVACAQQLLERFGGRVPDDYDSLISLPGVGRKTANVVQSVGFGHQRIAVDTHVFRVTNRIGIVKEKDVLKTELALMKTLPEDRWTEAHHSFIFHGRNCCSARNPKCGSCVIADLCKKKGVK